MIKQLAGCIKEYKKDSIITPLLVTMEVFMEIIIPLLMANLIDFGIDKGNINYIVKMGIVLALSALISLLFGAMAGKSAATASSGFAKNLRYDMYCNVQDFSFSNIDKYSPPGIVTRLTTDVTNVQNAYQMLIRIAVRSPLMMLFALIMTFSISVKFSLIFLAAILIIGTILYYLIRKAHPVFTKVFKTYDNLNNVVQENISGIRVVKSYVREDYEIEKFNTVAESIFKDFSKAEKIVAFNMPCMQFCIYTCMLLISWFGANLIVGSSMTTGQLTSIISYAMQIMMSLMMFSMMFVIVTMARSSAERITEILEEKSDLHNNDVALCEVPNGCVDFENVDFSYVNDKNKLCLSNINFSVKTGETVGIIGGTGSSKTTLVQLIPRLYDVTKGSVKVGGIDVKDYDIEALRNEVAMVLQNNTLFSGTIKENLKWGCENASDEEMIYACKLSQADNFIRDFKDGYDTYIEQGGTNVSGGQKQRLCIARAILKKPKILILDDSTSAVDTKTDSLIRKAFSEEIPETTKFIISQRISSIENADKIIVMNNGKIDSIGTHNELLEKSSIYKDIYFSQTKGDNKDE